MFETTGYVLYIEYYMYIFNVFKEQLMSFKSEKKTISYASIGFFFIMMFNMPPAKCLCVLCNMS